MAEKLKIITEIPKDIVDLDKKILFLEVNQHFIKKINIDDWLAHCIYYNKINMIAMLNNFIREYDITIEPTIIYKSLVYIECRNALREMMRYTPDIQVNWNMKMMLQEIMDKYVNLFDKKRNLI